MLAAFDPELPERMVDFQAELNTQATDKGKKLRAKVRRARGERRTEQSKLNTAQHAGIHACGRPIAR